MKGIEKETHRCIGHLLCNVLGQLGAAIVKSWWVGLPEPRRF